MAECDVRQLFERFMERLRQYGIGDARLYASFDRRSAKQHSLNAYLKTEDDVKVKFGGYLEEVFRQSASELTVHAELPLYPHSRETADLSIHRVRARDLWLRQSDIADSAIAVIEVKYANWKHPDHDFKKNKSTIQDDLRKLGTLSNRPECRKYLLLVDECCAMSQTCVDEVRRLSEQQGVTLLANHPGLRIAPVPTYPA